MLATTAALCPRALASPGPDAATLAAPPVAFAPFEAPSPDVAAAAAYVFDATTGTELYALAPDERRSPASLTKVATALVVLRHVDLDAPVTIEPSDLVDDSQSRVDLVAGDTLSVRDLLAGMLIQSGNDAAQALARSIGAELADGGDPRAAFVAEMNAIVADLGLSNTHFVNTAGLDAPNHHASARDLALLTVEAMKDPVFAQFVATPEMVLVSEIKPDGYTVLTTNDLLLDGTAQGVKTGTTLDAGGCLITAFTIDGNQIIAVLLGSPLDPNAPTLSSPERFNDMRRIMADAPADYRWLDPSIIGEIDGLAEELAVWETALPPGPALVVPTGREEDLRYRLQLGPPAEPDQEVGTVLFFVGSDLLSERPVVQLEAAA